MAHIELSRTHNATPAALRQAVQQVVTDADLYGLFFQWKNPDLLLVEGKGVEARVELSPTELSVAVTLPWLFRLVKGVIADEVATKMRTIIAEAEGQPSA